MKDFPYTVLTNKECVEQARQWCEQHLGPRWEVTGNRQGKWCCFWCGPSRKKEHWSMFEWHFENERDALLFRLKWS